MRPGSCLSQSKCLLADLRAGARRHSASPCGLVAFGEGCPGQELRTQLLLEPPQGWVEGVLLWISLRQRV